MHLRHFTSESYPEGGRDAAWQDLIGRFGLRSTFPPHGLMVHATATLRGSPDGISIAKLAAGPQMLTPLQQRADLPLLLGIPEDGAVLLVDGSRRPVAGGELLILPRPGDWKVEFDRDIRATALSVPAAAFRGRRIGPFEFGPARLVRPEGLAAVLSRALEATAEDLDAISLADWPAVDQSLAELLLTLVRQPTGGAVDAGGTAGQTALLHRIGQTVERRLDNPDLTPARVAQIEGISERYLQKLFEGTGDNFTHYLRERRLHRTWVDLANPAEAHQSVSEIAYSCGFSDAAHFSRAFRERYGISPRVFRQQEAERLTALAGPQEQRGWPQDVSVQRRARRSEPQAKAVHGTESGAHARTAGPDGRARHHHVPVDADHVHWGYFSRSLKPLVEIASGDTITVETLTQHASDDPERMIEGDPAAENVFLWTRDRKGVDRRGAGPMDASIFGRGAGEGFGVHICTGPIAVKGAQPGDVLEVRILNIVPRPSRNPSFAGRVFGSSAAAWWGYHYAELVSEPKPRETVTIYEIITAGDMPHAQALFSYRWEPQTDPFGVVHKTYDYPGVPVAPASVERRHGILGGIHIPLRPHFGVIAVAPREADLVDSIPPSYFGGNLDNWRLGRGAAIYLPGSVAGALLSIGDPHAAQGDGELGGTAIECSMTGTLKVVLHKKADLAGRPFEDLTYPLIETETDWVLTGFSHPNYLAEFGAKGQSEVYATSSVDLAMKDAFRKVRRFLMTVQGLSEDEAVALMSAAVDFGVTQVVDGNWGVHAILSKRLFTGHTAE